MLLGDTYFRAQFGCNHSDIVHSVLLEKEKKKKQNKLLETPRQDEPTSQKMLMHTWRGYKKKKGRKTWSIDRGAFNCLDTDRKRAAEGRGRAACTGPSPYRGAVESVRGEALANTPRQ